MSNPEAYHPLNKLKPVAENIWIVDARMPSNGFEMPVRMTVLRIGGEVILHSPTPYNVELLTALRDIGSIQHLVAPSVSHWTFLKDWQQAVPEAKTWAVAGLSERQQVRDAGLRIDEELDGTAQPFEPEIETVLVAGPIFRELTFFHRPTRTLVVTDLVLNLEPEGMSLGMRTANWLLGTLEPNGRAALYVRILLKLNRGKAGAAANRLVNYNPARVIFAHGTWFERDGTTRLRRSLRWLLPPDQGGESATKAISVLAAIGVVAAAALLWRHRKRRTRLERVVKELRRSIQSLEKRGSSRWK